MKKHAETAERLEHPLIKETVAKYAKDGFVPLRQVTVGRAVGKIVKEVRAEYGKDNVRVRPGHYQVFKEGKHFRLTHFDNGCIIFVKDIPESGAAVEPSPNKPLFQRGECR